MVLEELRAMIIREEVPSVGGAIQYGEIESDGLFTIFGVMDHRMNGRQAVRMAASRGIDIDEVLQSTQPDDLYALQRMIQPFQSQLENDINPRS